jgi:type II secretory pathway pseudopilin PulG
MPQPNQGQPNRPQTYLVPSVLVTLFAFLPIGVAALIFASQVESKYNQGDYAGAQSSSNTAKTLCVVGTCIAAPFYLLFISLFGFVLIAPSLTNQSGKAKQTEAKISIGAINRGQMSFYLDHDKFTPIIDEIGVSINPEGKYYRLEVSSEKEKATVTATAKEHRLKSYVGAVFHLNHQFESVICETDNATQLTPESPQIVGSKAQCPTGTSPL